MVKIYCVYVLYACNKKLYCTRLLNKVSNLPEIDFSDNRTEVQFHIEQKVKNIQVTINVTKNEF